MRSQTLCGVLLTVFTVLTGCLAFAQSDSNGTWTQMANVPLNPDTMLLLTDGSIAVQDYAQSDWWRLVPDQFGHYLDGTWVPMGNMTVQTTGTCATTPNTAGAGKGTGYYGCPYAPYDYASAVLMDGRLVVTGGEYIYDAATNYYSAETTEGSIWNWQTNSWATVTPPSGWTRIGDADSLVLANGQYILARNSGGTTGSVAIMTPEGGVGNFGPTTWTNLSPSGKADGNSEENWVLLPDGTVWTLDISKEPGSERYIPPYLNVGGDMTNGQWISAGPEPASIGVTVYKSGSEDGANVLLPNGNVFAISGNPAASGGGINALFSPPPTQYPPSTATGSWAAAPNYPTTTSPLTDCDGPASVMPNGNVFFTGSPGCYDAPSEYFEYVSGNPNLVQVISPYDPVLGAPVATVIASYYSRFIVLPDGNMLYSNDDGFETYIFTPNNNTPNPAWAPAITSYPTTVSPGTTNYVVAGTQFNGVTGSGYYGDDEANASNYPVVNFTNGTTGHVQYGRTHDHSSMGVQTGATIVSTYVDTPANLECGSASMVVIANGISSPSVPVTVDCTNSSPAFMTSPSNNASLLGPTATFQWAASTSASAYWVDVSAVAAGQGDLYSSGSLPSTTQSVAVSNLPVNGATLYVSLYSMFGHLWISNSYTYSAFNSQTGAAAMTYPAPSSTLTSPTVIFSWTEGKGASSYWLNISAVAPGGGDVYNSGAFDNILGNDGFPVALPVSGLPVNGETLYVTLYTQINGQWFSNSYTYTAFNAAESAATLSSPAANSTLSGPSIAFSWAAVTGATDYWLDVSKIQPGGNDIYQSKATTKTSLTVNGLPTTGIPVYVTLYTEIGGQWFSNQYTLTSFNTATGEATMISPTPSSTLSGVSATFTWTQDSNASAYWLDISAIQPGGNDVFQSGSLQTESVTVNTLPGTYPPTPIYVTLYSLVQGQWVNVKYTYNSGP
jgi:hypothetical protein